MGADEVILETVVAAAGMMCWYPINSEITFAAVTAAAALL